jgi:uncharacterized protein (DUF1697 family)
VTVFIALLRAVNVGGTGKLPMKDLAALFEEAGFARVETYIASGNVVFESDRAPATVKKDLEKRLSARMGSPQTVILRTSDEMQAVLRDNAFPKAPGNFAHAVFLDAAPPADAIASAKGVADEEIRLGHREIYVHYPSGAGRSKLRIPAAANGTARNMNTVAKLAEMAARRLPAKG